MQTVTAVSLNCFLPKTSLDDPRCVLRGERRKESFCSGTVDEERVVHCSENLSHHHCVGRVGKQEARKWERNSERKVGRGQRETEYSSKCYLGLLDPGSFLLEKQVLRD